jgi:hypothetical protein
MSIKIKTLFILSSLTVISALVVLRAQNKKSEPAQTLDEYQSQFPIVDYAAPEPTDSEDRARRRAIGDKYNKALTPISERSKVITSHIDWEVGLSAFPADKSQVVIIGEVLDAQAYLSNDKTGVYSEFKIRMDEILKNESGIPFNLGDSLIAERAGGRVRFPSGHITHSFIRAQGMPAVGQRYALFLTRKDKQINFIIITGYEFREGKIALLDNPVTHPIAAQKGADESTFLNELRAATAKPSRSPKK